jgi:hypothetical protein
MKAPALLLVPLLFLAGGSIALADDSNLLKNGDFSNGISEWEGDAHTVDSTTFDNPPASPPTSGVIIKMHRHDWTKVTQDFDGDIGEYTLTLTYSVSSDLKFSTDQEDYTNVPSLLNFSILAPFNSTPGDWVVIVNDLGAMQYTYWKITPKNDSSGVQKFSTQIQLNSGAAQKKGFYLCFPPGDGYINLLSISLTPKGGSSH